MISNLAASSSPSESTTGTQASASRSDGLGQSDSDGGPAFSAILRRRRSDATPIALAEPGSADTGTSLPIAPVPNVSAADRAGRKTKTGKDSEAILNTAVQTNLAQSLSHETQSHAKCSPLAQNAIDPMRATSLPPLSPTELADTSHWSTSTAASEVVAEGTPSNAQLSDAVENAAAETRLHLQRSQAAASKSSATASSADQKEGADRSVDSPVALSDLTAGLPAVGDQSARLTLASASSIAGQPRETGVSKDSTAPSVSSDVVPASGSAHSPVVAHAAPTNPTPSPGDQIHDPITAHLDPLRQLGRVEIQLNLRPPELGRVQLHLTLEDGQLNVHMLVQDESAKRLIDQQLEPLRVRFAEMGVSVGQFDVRRDGSSPNPEQQPAAEPSAQTLQADRATMPRLQKSYSKVGNADALVDVIA